MLSSGIGTARLGAGEGDSLRSCCSSSRVGVDPYTAICNVVLCIFSKIGVTGMAISHLPVWFICPRFPYVSLGGLLSFLSILHFQAEHSEELFIFWIAFEGA